MMLWKKTALITAAALLVSTGISGAAVIYQSARYNRKMTVRNYEQQLKVTAYAVGKELNYEPLENFSEAAANAYYHYVVKKYDASAYILIEEGETVCNMTPFDLANPADIRWNAENGYSLIQKNEKQYILITGRKVPTVGKKDYTLVLIQDISLLYEDIRVQAFFYLLIYLSMAAAAVFLVFLMTKKALAPMRELEQAARDISGGKLGRRANIHTQDEIGAMAAAFNGMAAQLENQVKELSLESERRRQMLGSLTHEMKTPMTSIMGYADSLLHVNLKEEQKKRALEHIYHECGRLGRISSKLTNLLGMYDNDSIHMEEVSVKELFERAAALEENNLKSKNMTLQYNCRPDRLRLFVDKDLLISLLINLIDNGIRASEEGGVIFLTAQENRITVCDLGCGIPKEDISRVTEAFYMVDKARSRKAGGSGLGLALCSRIAILHGAQLQIESKLGKGTIVSVVFENRS